MKRCPMCKGEGIRLGALGGKMWYRFRQCGWQYAGKARTSRAARRTEVGSNG